MFQHKYYLPLTVLMNFGPAILIGWLCGDVLGGIIWVGLLRLVVSHHLTFFINSLAHIWGKRPYTDTNTARDNGFLALFTWGEGYHNYHHIFAQDYRNGVRWYQWDPSKWLIFAASKVGLTSQLGRTDSSRFSVRCSTCSSRMRRRTWPAKAILRSGVPRSSTSTSSSCTTCTSGTPFVSSGSSDKRQQIAQKAAHLQTALHSRLMELEQALREQRRRVRSLTLQFA